MGLPLVIGLIIFEKDTRKDLLLKKISNIETGEEVALQVRYFTKLVMNKEHDRSARATIEGYIFNHEDNCTLVDC